jgi:hypothetical protein
MVAVTAVAVDISRRLVAREAILIGKMPSWETEHKSRVLRLQRMHCRGGL